MSTVSRQRIRHCARRYPQSGNRIWSDVGPLGDLCETKEHTQVWNYSFLQIYGGKSIYKEIYSMFLMSGKKTGEVISWQWSESPAHCVSQYLISYGAVVSTAQAKPQKFARETQFIPELLVKLNHVFIFSMTFQRMPSEFLLLTTRE